MPRISPRTVDGAHISKRIRHAVQHQNWDHAATDELHHGGAVIVFNDLFDKVYTLQRRDHAHAEAKRAMFEHEQFQGFSVS